MPSTILVYATRRGVNGFTLDSAIGEFTLSHPNIPCPEMGSPYSVNHGNFFLFDKGVRDYISACQQKGATEGRPFAFILEMACGAATDGSLPIHDLFPNSLHERSPLFIRSKRTIDSAMALPDPG